MVGETKTPCGTLRRPGFGVSCTTPFSRACSCLKKTTMSQCCLCTLPHRGNAHAMKLLQRTASLRSKSMDTNTQVLQRCFVKGSLESSDAVLPIYAGADDEVRRSEGNILQWMSYLPEDCIKTMIAMRWDVST